MTNREKRIAFVKAAIEEYGEKGSKVLSMQEVLTVCEKYGFSKPQWLTADPKYRSGRGLYNVPSIQSLGGAKTGTSDKISVKKPVAKIESAVPVTSSAVNMSPLTLVHNAERVEHVSLVPDKTPGYVPFGHFNDVRKIISSGIFYPMYITGLSGNGKTMMVEQICAQEKRELIRANLTKMTEEDDLLGGMRLINGQTVWQNGPAIHAMERGAVLLLDEVDLADEKIMCLQPVLEGKSVFLKKINRVVHPQPGFNIVATANTKGKGSDDGRFIGTNVMNEAFLERFSVTFEQEYPSLKVETKILSNVLKASGIENKDFVEKLVNWADTIRKAFAEGAISDIISTRRLVHICQAFVIFDQDREKAIQLCLNRFDVDTKTSFLDFYKKLDESLNPPVAQPMEAQALDATEVTF